MRIEDRDPLRFVSMNIKEGWFYSIRGEGEKLKISYLSSVREKRKTVSIRPQINTILIKNARRQIHAHVTLVGYLKVRLAWKIRKDSNEGKV